LVAIAVVFERRGNWDVVDNTASEESFEFWNAIFDEIVCDSEDKRAVPSVPFKNSFAVGVADKVGVCKELPLERNVNGNTVNGVLRTGKKA
jgi:hypothetical protein